MRPFLASLVLVPLLCGAARVPAAEGGGATATDCSVSAATGGDIRVISCPVEAGQPRRLTVNFTGGHDDTSASLAAEIDGQPAPCAADSKVRLFGEDGNVSLHCRIVGAPGAAHRLVVTVLWSHAQYRDFTWSAD